jgi:hypothetical protein
MEGGLAPALQPCSGPLERGDLRTLSQITEASERNARCSRAKQDPVQPDFQALPRALSALERFLSPLEYKA